MMMSKPFTKTDDDLNGTNPELETLKLLAEIRDILVEIRDK